MRYLKVLSLAASICVASVAFADLVKVYEGPAYPRCAGNDSQWPNRWNVTINIDDASEKEDFVKLLQVMGTGGFKTEGVNGFDKPEKYIFIKFDEGYYAGNPTKSEAVLIKGLETLADLKGVYISCSSIYRPMPALTIRN